jgi:hypothetical protein
MLEKPLRKIDDLSKEKSLAVEAGAMCEEP